MNASWHKRHQLRRDATLAQRIAWHREHQKQCACRPIPATVQQAMKRSAPSRSRHADTTGANDRSQAALDNPAYAAVVTALTKEPDVSYGGKGFGATGLKVRGKLFAMIDSDGKFVVKLPKDRVDALVRLGRGDYFAPSRGRQMKEWLALDGKRPSWLELAREAYAFVSGKAQP